jgi:SAM-dependent methyltransferase
VSASVDDQCLAEMSANEEDHFWFRGTRAIIVHALRRRLSRHGPRPRLLDAGCGTGFTIARAAPLGDWVGCDLSPAALRLSRQRSVDASWVQAAIGALPFDDASFDALVCLDVLEHLEDDLEAVLELRRVLRPGAFGIVSVPAWPRLFGPHDVALGHRRRYSRAQLATLLARAGFMVELLSSYNVVLAPVVFAARWLRRDQTSDTTDVARTPAWLNVPLATLLASERFVVDRLSVRGGISLMAVIRRRW